MSDYFYKEHPKNCDPDDFWGQVKRTVDGKPVSQEQIDMIVAAVTDGLDLGRDDVLLDLCCGNGALTTYFFQRCAGGVGVDFSEYLVEVAKRRFSARPEEHYVLGDALEYARSCPEPARFTRAVCYGAFMFLPAAGAAELLGALRRRFTSLGRLYIGNLPDKARMAGFYREGQYRPGMEDDPASPTGIWRTEEEFARLAAEQGWKASMRRMPPDFYAAHYRYDAVLVPAG
jgi:cyclopropane fatty-acyl-phospholipid synthase-like methyltransferase